VKTYRKGEAFVRIFATFAPLMASVFLVIYSYYWTLSFFVLCFFTCVFIFYFFRLYLAHICSSSELMIRKQKILIDNFLDVDFRLTIQTKVCINLYIFTHVYTFLIIHLFIFISNVSHILLFIDDNKVLTITAEILQQTWGNRWKSSWFPRNQWDSSNPSRRQKIFSPSVNP